MLRPSRICVTQQRALDQGLLTTDLWPLLWTPRDQKSGLDLSRAWVKDIGEALVVYILWWSKKKNLLSSSCSEWHCWGRAQEGGNNQAHARWPVHGEMWWENPVARLQEHHQGCANRKPCLHRRWSDHPHGQRNRYADKENHSRDSSCLLIVPPVLLGRR